MIDYDALAISLFALFLALIVVLLIHERNRRRRRKIVADPPWWDEFSDGKKFAPDNEETRFRRAYAESDGDHRSYVDWYRGN